MAVVLLLRLLLFGVLRGAIVQRIGHIPSKDTMLVRFQLASPEVVKKEKELALASSFSVSNTSVATPAGR